MHIWPSMRIRESFKIAYLTTTERNLRRMSSDKNYNRSGSLSNSTSPKPAAATPRNGHLEERLLPAEHGGGGPACSRSEKAGVVLRELLMALSCCYCCFCCGACLDQQVE